MKKEFLSLILIISMFLLIGCGEDEKASASAPSIQVENVPVVAEEKTEEVAEPVFDESDPKQKIEKVVTERITDEYRKTVIDRIEINANLGTEEECDFIVLPHLTWDVENSVDMTHQMLEMYSSDLAATLYNECPDVAEVCIFWTVPYHNNAAAKMQFVRTSGGMTWGDKMYDGDLR
ncbi:MAG: hypothetical protein Q4D29_05630 [Lachnospiraceae bacterium]|nr:hypothetical protein [Lachnospiraceae bacterium]